MKKPLIDNKYIKHKDYTSLIVYYKGNKLIGKIDTEDLNKVKEVGHWTVHQGKYIVHNYNDNGKTKHLFLHYLIMNNTPNRKLPIDHINRDKLDNRKSNLRICTARENSLNRGYKKQHRNIYPIKQKIKGKVYNYFRVEITKDNIKYSSIFNNINKAIQYRDTVLQNIYKDLEV